ncbi:hypothetical protein QR680_018964 [Steinernema hermaphroditum]|uniref:Small ribosomal subunit protein uS2 n=1 Tax=Steinernema hermaphroditum TaxID=289476 RepID=A0AA39HLV3_9BILA|nr:hypothetical protein QR680_018964 [Steinernema hermaphroditum]
MSAGNKNLALGEEDLMKLLACQAHIGSSNVDFQQEQYVYTRRQDGTYIINVKKTYEKLLLAARAIAAIENPADVVVVSARPYAQRALLKFAAHTGATPIFGRFTPGHLTNQIQKTFKEPRLLIVSDPRADFQAIREASYVNIPVISFCNTDSPMKLVDISIPCNNKGQQAVGLMWWFLAREVLILKGKISREAGFILDNKVIMPDLYFYRDPEEQEKEEQAVSEERKDWAQTHETKPEEPFRDEAEPVKLKLDATEIGDWAQASSNWNGSAPAAGTAGQSEWGQTDSGW